MDGASVGSLGLASRVLQPGWQVAASIPGATGYSHLLCVLATLTREKTITTLVYPTLELPKNRSVCREVC